MVGQGGGFAKSIPSRRRYRISFPNRPFRDWTGGGFMQPAASRIAAGGGGGNLRANRRFRASGALPVLAGDTPPPI